MATPCKGLVACYDSQGLDTYTLSVSDCFVARIKSYSTVITGFQFLRILLSIINSVFVLMALCDMQVARSC